MKVVKIIGIILAAIIAIVIILALIAPDEFYVERTMVINAPRNVVFNNVQYWSKWQAWSPWAEKDSTMKVEISADDGKVGAVYQWEGDPKVTGSGKMVTTAMKPDEEHAYHMNFYVPWQSESDGYMRLSDTLNGSTRAAWGFYGKSTFPYNIMLLFADMEDMMAPDFDRGLTLLKQISEAHAQNMKKYSVQKIDWPGKSYATLRDTVEIGSIAQFYGMAYNQIGAAVGKTGARVTGMPCGLYYRWKQSLGKTDVAAAIPVNRSVEEGKITMVDIEAQVAYMIDYYGPYEGLISAHSAMILYLSQNKLQPQMPAIEEYVTDPTTEPDPAKWCTRIYYFVHN